jgi:adenylate cyclase
MDDYFAEVFRPVRQRGGTVLDVVGDGMLAIWTSPTAGVEYRRDACHAALGIAASVDAFNADAPPDRVLRTRIALHCGELMLGSFGAADHFEYRAVGDIVNATSRIEGLNKMLGTRALASEAVLQGLDEFAVRPVGTFVLAGKSQPLALCELMGLRADEDSQQARLRERFAEALVAYIKGDCRTAGRHFGAIVADFPVDGPSIFYRDRCAARATSQRRPWDPVIRLATK